VALLSHPSTAVKICVLLALLAACYSPSVRDCTVTCATGDQCGGGQVCAGGWCTAPDVSCEGVAPPTDAPAVRIDAASPDADICPLGCTNGTCIAGVCVIDCSAPDSCPNDIVCPVNLPCRVLCGDRSCGHKVNCALASQCEVDCAGTDACKDEIICGKIECDVTCSGTASCKRRVKCKEACSCDVTCSGVGSCAETPECPLEMSCRLGLGCTSQLPGCDRCD